MFHRIVHRLLDLPARFVCCWLATGTACSALGQELQMVFPPTVGRGQSIDVELAGTKTGEFTQLRFSKSGIEAKVLAKGKATITVATDAPLGDGDLWAASAQALAAPVRFSVSEFPVQVEAEPNNSVDRAQPLELPTTLAGRIAPGTDGDWYRVQLEPGDGLTLACRSSSLGGGLLPTITVLDPQGREIAHDSMTRTEPIVHLRADHAGAYAICIQDRSYRTSKVPVYELTLTTGPRLVAAFPPSVERGTTASATLYGYQLPNGQPVEGRHELLDGPLGQLAVEITAPQQGRSGGTALPLAREAGLESFEYRHPGIGGSVRLELIDRSPIATSQATSNAAEPAEAPLLDLPAEIVGRFTSPRHVVNWYRFTAKKGESLWLEAVAQRIGQPCDLELIVYDAAGKSLEAIDNVTTPRGKTPAVPPDSRDGEGVWKVPANGEYRLAVRDLLATPTLAVERGYRVSIGPRREGVRLVAVLDAKNGSAWSLKPGGKLNITLQILRRNGHQAPITIEPRDLPPGITISPTVIDAKKATVTLTVVATADAPPGIVPLHVVAKTEVDKQPITVDIPLAAQVAGATPPLLRLCDEPCLAILPTDPKP